MLVRAPPPSEMRTCTSAACPKPWLRKNWSSSSLSTDASLPHAFWWTRWLVSSLSALLHFSSPLHQRWFLGPQKCNFPLDVFIKMQRRVECGMSVGPRCFIMCSVQSLFYLPPLDLFHPQGVHAVPELHFGYFFWAQCIRSHLSGEKGTRRKHY